MIDFGAFGDLDTLEHKVKLVTFSSFLIWSCMIWGSLHGFASFGG